MSDTQIYLVSPKAPDGSFEHALRVVLEAVPVASVLLLPDDGSDEAARPTVDVLRPLVQDRGIAFLIDGRPALAAATGSDGVHTCPIGPPYDECRRLLGPQAIVGYSCRNDRHDAMVHAEQGADYIVFGESAPDPSDTVRTIELIAWWSELMEVPCVALDRIGGHNARDFADAGADFLAIGPGLWDDARGPAKAAEAIAKAIDLI